MRDALTPMMQQYRWLRTGIPADTLLLFRLGDFTLSNFKSTTIGDNIVVTFTMTVAETIDGKRLPANPACR